MNNLRGSHPGSSGNFYSYAKDDFKNPDRKVDKTVNKVIRVTFAKTSEVYSFRKSDPSSKTPEYFERFLSDNTRLDGAEFASDLVVAVEGRKDSFIGTNRYKNFDDLVRDLDANTEKNEENLEKKVSELEVSGEELKEKAFKSAMELRIQIDQNLIKKNGLVKKTNNVWKSFFCGP